MKPFTELMDLILSPLKSAAAQSAQNLASGIGTTVQLGLTLYIILYGWQVARGEIAEPWNEFAKRAVKLGIIVALIQNTGFYQEYVIDFLAGSLPDALSNALSSKPIPDANAFDSLAKQVAILLTQIWQGTGWSAPAATARAGVVTLLVMPFLWCALIVGFVVTLWAKAGMIFVAALGPLFIALAMFEQTRKYLHNWIDQIVSLIALQILVALTCGLVIQGLEKATKSVPTPDTVFALAGHVIVLAVFSLAIWASLPRLASKLGGYGASLAGAGSRSAPMETLRAPFGAFNENGSPHPGRPELATIVSRGGDTRLVAPIVPPPVVGGDEAGEPASGRFSREAPVPARETDIAARSAVQSTPEGSTGGYNDLPHGATLLGAPPTSATAGTIAAASNTGAEAFLPASSSPAVGVMPSVSEPPASLAARPDATLGLMLADQRTGFEGVTFEATAPRVSEAPRIAVAAPVSAAINQTERPGTVALDTNPIVRSATDRSPS
jgi:type IV secretion system protein VirB6